MLTSPSRSAYLASLTTPTIEIDVPLPSRPTENVLPMTSGTSEIAARQRLVDDRHARRELVVALSKHTARQNLHADRGEIVCADEVVVHEHRLVGLRDVPANRHPGTAGARHERVFSRS
jgi:hypothetical protein